MFKSGPIWGQGSVSWPFSLRSTTTLLIRVWFNTKRVPLAGQILENLRSKFDLYHENTITHSINTLKINPESYLLKGTEPGLRFKKLKKLTPGVTATLRDPLTRGSERLAATTSL